MSEFYPTVNLKLNTILNECVLDKNLINDHYYYFMLSNRERIGNAFKYKKFNDDFCDTLTCYNNGEYTIGIIRPSYDEFLKKLLDILGVYKDKIEDDSNLTNELLNRVDLLKSINNEKDLKLMFPKIYKDLIDGRNYINNLDRLKRQDNISELDYASGEHYYYRCGLQRSLSRFITNQSKLYERYITNRFEFKKELENTSYNGYLKKNFNVDKLYMYIIDRYLSFCEESKNRLEIRKMIKYVTMYLKSDRNKDYSFIGDNGNKICYENIIIRYNNIIRKLNNNSREVNWVLIPEGNNIKKANKTGEAKVTIMNYEKVNRLKEIGNSKNSYYEGTNYQAKAIGLKKYRGYVAYIYENGEVILDRLFDSKAISSAVGNAIYNIRVEDFMLLSKLDKTTLRKCSNVGVIIHSKNWRDRVDKIISKDASEEDKKSTNQLIKKLKRTY